jgi:hypothetical protein
MFTIGNGRGRPHCQTAQDSLIGDILGFCTTLALCCVHARDPVAPGGARRGQAGHDAGTGEAAALLWDCLHTPVAKRRSRLCLDLRNPV